VGKIAIETRTPFILDYGLQAVKKTTVSERHRRFKAGRQNVQNGPQKWADKKKRRNPYVVRGTIPGANRWKVMCDSNRRSSWDCDRRTRSEI
jgi:hypothetical protein